MTPKQKLETLRSAYEDIVWMAIRYAHGRSTYAPGLVRYSIKNFQKVFPDWKPMQDNTLEPFECGGMRFKEDDLRDITNQSGK